MPVHDVTAKNPAKIYFTYVTDIEYAKGPSEPKSQFGRGETGHALYDEKQACFPKL